MKIAARIEKLAESATLAVSANAAKMKATGVDVIGFGVGEPDFDTPALVKQAGIEAIQKGRTKYPNPASGIAEAKQAVGTKFKRDNGLNYSPEQVIITSGGKMAAFLAIHSLVDPGDEVLIPSPYWVSYPEMVQLAGGVPVIIHGRYERDYKIPPQELIAAISPRTKLLILNSPCNPTGVTYSPDETRALAQALRGSDVVVLSDEIYDQLIYNGQRVLSFAAVDEDSYRRTLTLNAGSKTYSMTGWRIGYAAGPKELIAAMAKLQSQSTSGAATFTQVALSSALLADHQIVEVMRIEFERRGQAMWRRLCTFSGVRCVQPTGAFYCFPDVSGTYKRLGVRGSIEFANRLLESAHVAVVPGSAFGNDDNVRLSFAVGMEQIEKGLDRMAQFLR